MSEQTDKTRIKLLRKGEFDHGLYPVGIWCQNDVVLTSMRRNHVASTLIRRHFRTKCPLGSVCYLLKFYLTFPEMVRKPFQEVSI